MFLIIIETVHSGHFRGQRAASEVINQFRQRKYVRRRTHPLEDFAQQTKGKVQDTTSSDAQNPKGKVQQINWGKVQQTGKRKSVQQIDMSPDARTEYDLMVLGAKEKLEILLQKDTGKQILQQVKHTHMHMHTNTQTHIHI